MPVSGGRGVVVMIGVVSFDGVAGGISSSSCMSCDTGREGNESSSSEYCEDAATEGGISAGARSYAAESCSFRTVISSFASVSRHETPVSGGQEGRRTS